MLQYMRHLRMGGLQGSCTANATWQLGLGKKGGLLPAAFTTRCEGCRVPS